jgi:hypothetical protein
MNDDRFKSDEEMSIEDWISFHNTGKRPEREEYVQRRRKALEDAGLEPDREEPKSIEEMDIPDHANRKYGRNQ